MNALKLALGRDATFYSIHGMGRYGDQLVVRAGGYRRVPSPRDFDL